MLVHLSYNIGSLALECWFAGPVCESVFAEFSVPIPLIYAYTGCVCCEVHIRDEMCICGETMPHCRHVCKAPKHATSIYGVYMAYTERYSANAAVCFRHATEPAMPPPHYICVVWSVVL